jgi:hypothetical protein
MIPNIFYVKLGVQFNWMYQHDFYIIIYGFALTKKSCVARAHLLVAEVRDKRSTNGHVSITPYPARCRNPKTEMHGWFEAAGNNMVMMPIYMYGLKWRSLAPIAASFFPSFLPSFLPLLALTQVTLTRTHRWEVRVDGSNASARYDHKFTMLASFRLPTG